MAAIVMAQNTICCFLGIGTAASPQCHFCPPLASELLRGVGQMVKNTFLFNKRRRVE